MMCSRAGFIRDTVVVLFAATLCLSPDVFAQSSESPAERCSWEGWLPPSVGRERVRRAAHLDAAATADLQTRTRSADTNMRLLAAVRLGAAQDDASVRALIALTDDLEVIVREAAARSLGRVGATSATSVIERLATSGNDHLRQGAVWALGQLQDRSAVNTLIAASRDTSKHVRADATWALGLIGGKAAAVRVTELALDANPHVRLAAVCSLERIHDARDPRAREVLSALSRDSVALVRETARWAAARLAIAPPVP
jgi:HEAT repeat protein